MKRLCVALIVGVIMLWQPVYGEPVTGVSISAPDKSLEVGQTVQYTANVKPSDAGDKSVIWSSSDKRVADVDSNGFIVANRPGTCIIRVKTVEGSYSATVTVTVSEKDVAVKSLSFKAYDHTMYVDDSYTVRYTVYPEKATNQKISWRSSNTSVATVSSGVVKGVAPGTCKIIGTTDDGDYEASMIMNIRALPANPFADIDKSKYRNNIILLSNQGIVNGYGGNYRPADPMTRAEFAAVVTKALELKNPNPEKQIADVPPAEWYHHGVMAAYGNRLLTGYPDGMLHPKDSITLEEAVASLTRLFANELELSEFPRSSKKFTCSSWATAYIDYAANNEIVDVSKISKLNKNATRDEIAVIVYNVLKKQGRLTVPE